MAQIAADELDVAIARIVVQIRRHRADARTRATPPAASRCSSAASRCGWSAPRCARCSSTQPRRRSAARRASCRSATAQFLRGGSRPARITGRSPARSIWPQRHRRAPAQSRRRITRSSAVSAARLDLPAKVFGEPAFVHDMTARRHAARARGAPAQSRRDARRRSTRPRSGAPPRAAIEIVRDGNFVAIRRRRRDSRRGRGGGRRQRTSRWDERRAAQRRCSRRRAGCCSSPSHRPRRRRAEPADPRTAASAARRPTPGCTSRTPRWRRPAGSRVYRDGQLTVWTHSQGVYPLRDALARTLEARSGRRSPCITCRAPGCYGHNGADDAAADAAVIAMRRPGAPVRVRWRREEEFGFEPVSPPWW